MRTASVVLVTAVLGIAGSAQAAALLQWDFGTSNGNVATAAATTVDAGMQGSTLSRGSNMPAAACGFQPTRGSFTTETSYSAGTLAAAVTNNAYYQFVVAPQAGQKMSLSSVDFAGYQQNTHAGATIEVLYSLDGFATAGTSVGSVSNISENWSGAPYSVSTVSVPALQNVENAVTFRLYFFGFGPWEQRGLGQISGSNVDLGLSGTVAAVPEPAILGMMGAASSMLLVRRRK